MTRPSRSPGSGTAVVRAGSRGPAVQDLQRRLRALGFDLTPDSDGVCGDATAAAIRAFQAQRGIRVDGACGAETWGALSDSRYRLGDRLLSACQPMLRGDDVGDLQGRLNALGFDAGKEDGIFGPDTERALVEFQRNAGLTSDGVCGRETIGALVRLGTRAAGMVASVRERDALRDPRSLSGHRVFVTATPALEGLGARLVDGLLAAGATAVLDISDHTEAGVAGAANGYGADLFLAIRPRSAAVGEPHGTVSCRCCYYESGRFRSEAGYAIAAAVAERVAAAWGGTGAACGRTYAVLRETRMPAVVCEPVVEGDEAGIAAVAASPERTADAVLAAIRDLLERPRPPG